MQLLPLGLQTTCVSSTLYKDPDSRGTGVNLTQTYSWGHHLLALLKAHGSPPVTYEGLRGLNQGPHVVCVAPQQSYTGSHRVPDNCIRHWGHKRKGPSGLHAGGAQSNSRGRGPLTLRGGTGPGHEEGNAAKPTLHPSPS